MINFKFKLAENFPRAIIAVLGESGSSECD